MCSIARCKWKPAFKQREIVKENGAGMMESKPGIRAVEFVEHLGAFDLQTVRTIITDFMLQGTQESAMAYPYEEDHGDNNDEKRQAIRDSHL